MGGFLRRRNLLQLALALTPAALLASRAEAEAKSDAPEAGKVVYHLADLDKVDFVLGNINNHYEGMGGPDKVVIALVIHGSALKAFHAADASPDRKKRTADLVKNGLQPSACIHTMRAQTVTVEDLLPGFAVADKGGVVRLAQLQAQGYAYLRP
jgi:intracellular sulfur oxidation DsrE/DsrF family protein